jgi:hypothetical protein
MTTPRKVLAFLGTLFAVCQLHAADSKPIARVISITEVATDDPTGYATWAAKTNEIAKAKLGIDSYLRIFVSNFDGKQTNSVRVVIAADSVAALTKNAAALEKDPAVLEIRDHYRAIRKLEGRVLYQAVRFESSPKNASVFSTTAVITDEPAYLKSLDGLRALFDKAGLQDAKINAYRVIAGRTDHTHRISINAPNDERLAAFLDFSANSPDMPAWFASVAGIRTTVTNTTSRDITK